jgi:hypothetical protein
MRRKTSASVLARREGEQRSLRPARVQSLFLPTAASIAVALASMACSTPTLDVIAADPANKAMSAPPPAPAPSPSPSVAPYIEPDPHDIDGDVAFVKPVASPKKTPAKAHP